MAEGKKEVDSKKTTTEPPEEPGNEILDREKIINELKKLRNIIDAGKECGFCMNHSQPVYNSAYDFLKKNEIDQADMQRSNIYEKIRSDISFPSYGMNRWQWAGYLVFFRAKTWGITPFVYSVLVALVFVGFMANYPSTKIDFNGSILVGFIHLPSTIIGIPLWAAFLGGLGSCTQILWRLVHDIKTKGVVSDDGLLWYLTLPFLALMFGYIAYILMDMGVMVLGGSASDTGSSAGNVIIEGRIIACFLAGFATDKFLKKLDDLANSLFRPQNNEN